MIDYAHFHESLKNLERFWQRYQDTTNNQTDNIDREMDRMALVQAYEVNYEAMMKALGRYLTDEIGIKIIGNKPMLREADKSNLLSSELQRWFHYTDLRNQSSHEYGSQKTDHIIEIMPDFIDDAIGLYQTMTEKTWD